MGRILVAILIYFITLIITWFIAVKVYRYILKSSNKQIVISVIAIIIVINLIFVYLSVLDSKFPIYLIVIFKSIPASTAVIIGVLYQNRNRFNKHL